MSTSAFLNAFSQIGSQYASDYLKASNATGVPASVLAAQDYQESTFGTAVGNGGGIAQFEPGTINGMGSSIAAVQNPSIGIQEQAAYMQTLIKQNGGNIAAALSAYNTGDPASPTGLKYANSIIQNANSLGNTAAITGQVTGVGLLNEIPAPSQQTLAEAAASANKGCPTLSVSPSSWTPWLQCEGYNMILMLLGIMGVVIAFSSMFKVSPVDIAAAVAE